MQNDNLNDSLREALAKATIDSTIYTIERKEGKDIRVLLCGCEFPMDVDHVAWFYEHRDEHRARHSIATIELKPIDTGEE